MKIGMVGLGKMGLNMTKRLIQDGHEVVVYDVNDEPIAEAKEAGASPSTSHEDMVSQLEAPRTVWVMVPAGKITGDVIDSFAELLDEGDAIIDGGNSFYQDTLARVGELEPHGVDLLDAGTSGGVWGLKEGYSLMVGGPDAAVDRLRPIFETLAPGPEKGWGHVGKTGSGHFVKMVHNGIEYGMMEAYAEGFHIMHDKEEFNLDLHQIAEIWRYGSVVRSWLLDLASNALKEKPRSGRPRRLRLRLGRGPLDCERSHRPGRPGSGDHARADGAAALARRELVYRPAALGAAQRVRRPLGRAPRPDRGWQAPASV